MRTLVLVLTTILTSATLASEPAQHPVTVELGPKAYRDGDVAQITHVASTSARLEQGDSVTVKGRVRLDSAPEARLCLYVTQTKGDGSEETDATQEVAVQRGRSEFELTTTIKHQGVLHLTFYNSDTGKPFGGVYFGTADQMNSISSWDVSYYLRD